MRKVKSNHKAHPAPAPKRKAPRSGGRVDESMLRTAWMAESALCLLLSLSAIIVAAIY